MFCQVHNSHFWGSRRHQVFDLPEPICDPRLHRRRHSERLVNPNEVVPSEVQAERIPEVFPLLRERIGERWLRLLPAFTASILHEWQVM